MKVVYEQSIRLVDFFSRRITQHIVQPEVEARNGPQVREAARVARRASQPKTCEPKVKLFEKVVLKITVVSMQ